ncbi:hypothetical protein AAEU29_05845 [Pseudoalteromonas sp. SSM20]|uniref:hypothetical protein n=1 Tax=Pseudoalteromonas sp. SSM20 TaxID=3139394 RepID=UPI003BAB4C0B
MKLFKSIINIACLSTSLILISESSFAFSTATELTKQNLTAINNSNEDSAVRSFIKMKLTHKKIAFQEEGGVIYTSSAKGGIKNQILIDARNPKTFDEFATILNKIDTNINTSNSRIVILLNTSDEILKSLSKSDVTISLDSPYPSILNFYGRSIINIQFSENVVNEIEHESLKLSQFSSTQDNNFPILASILIENITPELFTKIKNRSENLKKVSRIRSEKKSVVSYAFLNQTNGLKIVARGEFFGHDQEIMNINAISYLASLFKGLPIDLTTSGQAVKYLNSLLALNPYAVRFGELAFKDEDMGPLTLWPQSINSDGNYINLELNSRFPNGKSIEEIERNVLDISKKWQDHFKVSSLKTQVNSTPAKRTNTTVFSSQINEILNSIKHKDKGSEYLSKERMLSDMVEDGLALSLNQTDLEKLLQILIQN